MFLKYTFHAILTTGCLILKQFKYTNLGQQYAFFGSVKTKPYYSSSDLQGDIWSWQHYRHSESRGWPHKEPWPQWRGNSLLSLESMLSLVLGEPMPYHCWEEPEPPGEPGYSKCWSHTDKESVASCVKFRKHTLELTVDYRPWRSSMLKTFLRRQMGTQLAPSIQLCQYKQYAKEVGIFPTASGWMKWQMSLCMNWVLHFPGLGQQTLTVFFFGKDSQGSSWWLPANAVDRHHEASLIYHSGSPSTPASASYSVPLSEVTVCCSFQTIRSSFLTFPEGTLQLEEA